jgi:hypothetical protein
MPSHDETVSRERITQILLRVRCDGWQSLFGVLEHQEPVLAAYALATADLLAEKLRSYGMPRGMVLFVHSEIIIAEMVCIESMRQASRELWKDFLPDAEPEKQS